MQLEIWSDIVCPFCYMGKRRLEDAMKRFPHSDEVALIWRSYQLDPGVQPTPGKGISEYLAERKGITPASSAGLHAQLEKAAAELGLSYHFDTVVVANSFDAHRLAHLARVNGLQERMQERLFAAYFTEGRDIGAEGVPFFVIDRRHGFVGAQPSDLILEVLTKAWSEQISA